MKKPLIAVTPLFNERLKNVWMISDYTDSVIRAGGIPVILPLDLEEADLIGLAGYFDGFLFTGGQDVNPALYGEEKMEYCEEIHVGRDTTEGILLKEVLALNKPVLGICRGMQFLNVSLGGTLYQDIHIQHPPSAESIHLQKGEYDTPIHPVQVLEDSLLFKLVNSPEIQVNSIHHQALKDLSPLLKTNAISEDGLIEAVHMPGKDFVMAVQWHPEFLSATDPMAAKLFSALVESCIKQKKSKAISEAESCPA